MTRRCVGPSGHKRGKRSDELCSRRGFPVASGSSTSRCRASRIRTCLMSPLSCGQRGGSLLELRSVCPRTHNGMSRGFGWRFCADRDSRDRRSSSRDSRYEMPSTSMQVTEGDGTTSGRLVAWLDRPLLGRHCVLAWILATIVFLGMIALLGGPTANDSGESLYSTWAIAHGDFGCAYPHVTQALAQNYLPI